MFMLKSVNCRLSEVYLTSDFMATAAAKPGDIIAAIMSIALREPDLKARRLCSK